MYYYVNGNFVSEIKLYDVYQIEESGLLSSKRRS